MRIIILQRVPYTFFVTREWSFLLCVKRKCRFIFSVIRESIFFRPRETVFDFSVIREICIYFRVICEPTTLAGIIFTFLETSCKLHQTRCKTYQFDAFALTTGTLTVSLEGLESAIMDKSLGTNLHFRRF